MNTSNILVKEKLLAASLIFPRLHQLTCILLCVALVIGHVDLFLSLINYHVLGNEGDVLGAAWLVFLLPILPFFVYLSSYSRVTVLISLVVFTVPLFAGAILFLIYNVFALGVLVDLGDGDYSFLHALDARHGIEKQDYTYSRRTVNDGSLLILCGLVFNFMYLRLILSMGFSGLRLLFARRDDLRSWVTGRRSWTSPIFRTFDIPKTLEFLGRGRVFVATTHTVSLLLFCAASYLAFGWYQSLAGASLLLTGFHLWNVDGSGSSVPITLFSIIALPVFIFPLWLAARFVRTLSRRKLRLTAQEMLSQDPRPPVLFLRPFRDDQLSFGVDQPSSMVRMLNAGRLPQKLDHLLIEDATQYGPVVGLGRPEDPSAPYGAARLYSDHDSWQEQVIALACEARAIVVVIDASPGLTWELEMIASDTDLLSRTLFLWHPHLERGPTLSMGPIRDFEDFFFPQPGCLQLPQRERHLHLPKWTAT